MQPQGHRVLGAVGRGLGLGHGVAHDRAHRRARGVVDRNAGKRAQVVDTALGVHEVEVDAVRAAGSKVKGEVVAVAESGVAGPSRARGVADALLAAVVPVGGHVHARLGGRTAARLGDVERRGLPRRRGIVPLHREGHAVAGGRRGVSVGLLGAGGGAGARPARTRLARARRRRHRSLVLGVRTVCVVGRRRRVGGLPAVVVQAVLHRRVGAQEVVVAHVDVKAGVGAVGVDRVIPGHVHVVPVAAHLHHVPGMAHVVAHHKDAGHARAREQQLVGQRVALAHGRAARQGAVGGEGRRGQGRAGGGAVVDAVAHQVVVQGLGNLEVGHVVGVDPA